MRTKVAAFDPHVQQPHGEDHSSESLKPDEDFQAEISLVRPIELRGLDYGGDDETETINNRILVNPFQ